tara:strand:- start:116 stop:649 length:534 start_codon:yes stop_codon:yes gene_type:complete
MELNNLDEVLNKYAKYVVQQSKSNLTKDQKGGGALYNSISYDLEEEAKGFLVDFLMEDYGIFVDEGVKGANPSLIKGGVQKAPLSKFKYTNKMPPMKILANWAKSKNIRFRNAKGQYQKGNNRSMGFALQKSIYAQGLRGNKFFTKPLEKGLKILSPELAKSFALDVENAIILGIRK